MFILIFHVAIRVKDKLLLWMMYYIYSVTLVHDTLHQSAIKLKPLTGEVNYINYLITVAPVREGGIRQA